MVGKDQLPTVRRPAQNSAAWRFYQAFGLFRAVGERGQPQAGRLIFAT